MIFQCKPAAGAKILRFSYRFRVFCCSESESRMKFWKIIYRFFSEYFSLEPIYVDILKIIYIYIYELVREIENPEETIFFPIMSISRPSLNRSFSALSRSWELCFGYVSGLVGRRGVFGICWDFSWDSWRFRNFPKIENYFFRNSILRFSVTV